MAASALCDVRGFVGRLEEVYRGLWQAWLDGEDGEEEEEGGGGGSGGAAANGVAAA